MDYEEMILSKQEDIYDGVLDLENKIEIREFNFGTGQYETKSILSGEAAIHYMDKHGIY